MSIFDEKEQMINSNFSGDAYNIQSSLLKKMRTTKHSKFSNNLLMDSSSIVKNSLGNSLKKKSTSKLNLNYSDNEQENIPSDMCCEENPISVLIANYTSIKS